MHIFDTVVSIPPSETSRQESISLFFINFITVEPLFFSLKRLISGGGPFFSFKYF